MTSPPVPAVALRTYRFLRFAVVCVVVMLIASLLLEAGRSGCLKGSISAYYYSPVRTVFVGALCAIGLVLIALWGKTALEDSLFNLAGLLAPVVAFVPAKDDGQCRAVTQIGVRLTDEEKLAVLAAARADSYAAIENNMRAYLGIVLVVLAALTLIAAFAHDRWPLVTDNKLTFWTPLVLAWVLWALGAWQFYLRNSEPNGASWFYQRVHFTSAIVMFGFITVGILWIGVTRWYGSRRPSTSEGSRSKRLRRRVLNAGLGEPAASPEESRGWALLYGGQALAMIAVSAFLFLAAAKDWGPPCFLEHHVYWIEMWMIVNVAAFWSLQTKERWNEGAPPRTKVETARAADRARDQEAEMPRQIITTPNAPSSPLFAQGVIAGSQVFVSGTTGVDASTGQMAGDSIQAQTRQALANCEAILREAGATLDDVVEVGVLLTDPGDFAGMNEEYGRWFPTDPPTRYAAKLGAEIPGLLVSIRMTASLA